MRIQNGREVFGEREEGLRSFFFLSFLGLLFFFLLLCARSRIYSYILASLGGKKKRTKNRSVRRGRGEEGGGGEEGLNSK